MLDVIDYTVAAIMRPPTIETERERAVRIVEAMIRRGDCTSRDIEAATGINRDRVPTIALQITNIGVRRVGSTYYWSICQGAPLVNERHDSVVECLKDKALTVSQAAEELGIGRTAAADLLLLLAGKGRLVSRLCDDDGRRILYYSVHKHLLPPPRKAAKDRIAEVLKGQVMTVPEIVQATSLARATVAHALHAIGAIEAGRTPPSRNGRGLIKWTM